MTTPAGREGENRQPIAPHRWRWIPRRLGAGRDFSPDQPAVRLAEGRRSAGPGSAVRAAGVRERPVPGEGARVRDAPRPEVSCSSGWRRGRAENRTREPPARRLRGTAQGHRGDHRLGRDGRFARWARARRQWGPLFIPCRAAAAPGSRIDPRRFEKLGPGLRRARRTCPLSAGEVAGRRASRPRPLPSLPGYSARARGQ